MFLEVTFRFLHHRVRWDEVLCIVKECLTRAALNLLQTRLCWQLISFIFYKDSSFLQRLYHGSGVSRNRYGIDLIPQNIFGIFEFRHQSVSYRIAIHYHTESNHGYIVFEAKLYITKSTVCSAPVLHRCFVWCQQNEQLPWASHQIRKIAGCACAGNGGNVSPHC